MIMKEILSDALPILEKFSPTIGEAILNPVGAACRYSLSILCSVFEVHPFNIKELVGKILTDLEAKEKLQNIENEHKDWVKSLMNVAPALVAAKINIELNWQPSSSAPSTIV